MSVWGDHNRLTQPPPTTYRDELDARRSGVRVPEQEYPYGYLETANPSRREDRFLRQLVRRQGARNYTRGIHAGSRVRPWDYVWPPGFEPTAGLAAQARGERWRPRPELDHVLLTNEGKPVPRGAHSLLSYPPRHTPEDLRRFKSPWS